MKVFSLSTGADTAGISFGLKQAFDRVPGWTFRSMVASLNYIRYPTDVGWSRKGLEALYDGADVIQLHNTLHGHRWYDAGRRQGKPTVLMHHGMHSREDYALHCAEARSIGAVQIGSTLDLSVHEPDVTWSPPPVDLTAMRKLRARNYRPGRKIRIAHAPTNAAIKGTAAFKEAVRHLSARYPIKVELIEKLPWVDCLARKAQADIVFDQPVLGYGVNAVEAWAMGIPVLAGVADSGVREAMIDRWGVLPFYEVTEATLEDRLEDMIVNHELRAVYSARGTAHVERWHSQEAVVKRLQPIYEAAAPTVAGRAERRVLVAA